MTAIETAADAIKTARGSESQQAFATGIEASIAQLQRWEYAKGCPTRYDHIEALVKRGVPRKVLEAALAEQTAGQARAKKGGRSAA